MLVISNVDCPEIRELYKGELSVPLKRSKAIGNAIGNSRPQRELLVVYDAPEWHEAWKRAAVNGQPFVNQLELLPHPPPLK